MWVRDELHVTKIGAKRNIKVNSYGERGHPVLSQNIVNLEM